MKKSNRLMAALISTIAATFLFSVSASAHVSVKPSTSTTEAWETYTMKVPVEKDVPTTKVTLKIPDGVEFEQYQPVPGWTVSEQKDASGKATSITWTATGEGILSGQFQQFTFVAKNPASGQKVAWDAYQYYTDGSIVEWAGEEGSDTPHSITEISAASSTEKQDQTVTDTTKTQSNTGGVQTIPTVVSIISLLVSIAALISALRRKK
jgi:uncharacterized protein YcnI